MTPPVAEAKPRILDGITVLDFTMVMAGPLCTRMLADLGARVIKVEPVRGDHIRNRPPLREGKSTYFGQLNCGKESIVLDLKAPGALDIAKRLIAQADIVVENFRPGAMARLGLGYEAVSAYHPELIYCSISGFGQTGPSSQLPAYAPIIHAASGFDLATQRYEGGDGPPPKNGIFIADAIAGSYAFGAIQSALYHRERTGTGQYIDVALMDGMLSLLPFETQAAQFPDTVYRKPFAPSRAMDGYVIVAPVTQIDFERVVALCGNVSWRSDPRLATVADRERNWEFYMAQIEAWTEQRTVEECETLMSANGIACSRYRQVAETLADPQLAHRGSLAQVHDDAGGFLVPNLPFQFSAATVNAGATVPGLGADTDAVLRDVLALGEDEICALRNAGVFG